MAGPPPPPSFGGPPPPPGPPPGFGRSSNSARPDHPPPIFGNDALLKDIRKGKKLKHTVTNDRSAPMIEGKVVGTGGVLSGNPSSNTQMGNAPSIPGMKSSSSMAPASSVPSIPIAGTPDMSGLFAGGMPKLRHRSGGVQLGNESNSSTQEQPIANAPAIKPLSSLKKTNNIKLMPAAPFHQPPPVSSSGPSELATGSAPSLPSASAPPIPPSATPPVPKGTAPPVPTNSAPAIPSSKKPTHLQPPIPTKRPLGKSPSPKPASKPSHISSKKPPPSIPTRPKKGHLHSVSGSSINSNASNSSFSAPSPISSNPPAIPTGVAPPIPGSAPPPPPSIPGISVSSPTTSAPLPPIPGISVSPPTTSAPSPPKTPNTTHKHHHFESMILSDTPKHTPTHSTPPSPIPSSESYEAPGASHHHGKKFSSAAASLAASLNGTAPVSSKSPSLCPSPSEPAPAVPPTPSGAPPPPPVPSPGFGSSASSDVLMTPGSPPIYSSHSPNPSTPAPPPPSFSVSSTPNIPPPPPPSEKQEYVKPPSHQTSKFGGLSSIASVLPNLRHRAVSSPSSEHHEASPPPSSGIRKIDPSAYTIGSSNKPSSGSMAENGPKKNSRIVIDDSWLKFNNENDIPKPRPFINKTKLYPSGRGSSVPLNLASF